ncbi:MAG: hypothetical protein KIT76_09340 [Pseudolabrys sp.]|nr:hypothetical protein [Pseudolabrys sp.]
MPKSDADADEQHLFSLLRDHHFEERPAWVRLAGVETGGKGAGGAKPKSKQAEAKAKQRVHDRENGWAECYAKAPDDDEARRLIAEVGKALKDPRTRRGLRILLRNPRAALLGERVFRRRGIRWFIARLVLGGSRRLNGLRKH